MAELVEHVEHPILASIVGAILDEVLGADLIAVLRAQPKCTIRRPARAGRAWTAYGESSAARVQMRSTRLSLISSPPGAGARRPCGSGYEALC
jgi:hypothetical protein